MVTQPNIAAAAFLIADPARANMLMSLLDGRARPAGELAYAAGVTPQTASSHLGKLLDGGLLLVETQGRHRYYRLAGAHVALALENMASISSIGVARTRPPTRDAKKLQFARCCYDHLAGRVGVAVTGGMLGRGYLVVADDKQFAVTPHGADWCAHIGVDIADVKKSRRGLARQCLDWTEREHHLGGPLGVRLLKSFCAQGWLQRSESSRAVEVTPTGWMAFEQHLDITLDALSAASSL